MVLAGIQKNSFIDYPGRVSCVLFLKGCNFRCPYCHNPGLVNEKVPLASLDEHMVYDFLEERKGLLDAVVISGGEPTLNGDLVSLCERIKHMGYPVKIDTNGSNPRALQRLIQQGIVDYIAMDIKTDPFRYSPMIAECDPDSIFASIRMIMHSSTPYEFRTTCVKPLVSPLVIQKIAENIHGAMLYVLQRFHLTKVLKPEFFLQSGAGCDEEELTRLKSVAEPWVEHCIIR